MRSRPQRGLPIRDSPPFGGLLKATASGRGWLLKSSRRIPEVRLASETRKLLTSYLFPGNLRELEDLIRNALVKGAGAGEVLPFHLPIALMQQRQPPAPEEEAAAVAW